MVAVMRKKIKADTDFNPRKKEWPEQMKASPHSSLDLRMLRRGWLGAGRAALRAATEGAVSSSPREVNRHPHTFMRESMLWTSTLLLGDRPLPPLQSVLPCLWGRPRWDPEACSLYVLMYVWHSQPLCCLDQVPPCSYQIHNQTDIETHSVVYWALYHTLQWTFWEGFWDSHPGLGFAIPLLQPPKYWYFSNK